MDGNDRSLIPGVGHRRHRSMVVVAAALAAVLGLAVGCTPEVSQAVLTPEMPQGVLHVPGQFVATTRYSTGWAPATVIMCLDSRSAVFIETGEGGDAWIGMIDLEWQGTTYHADNEGRIVTMTTPVLEPGCGKLSFFFVCCHVVERVAVKVTKV